MPYIRPPGNRVDLTISGNYGAPIGGQVDLPQYANELGESPGLSLNFIGTAGGYTPPRSEVSFPSRDTGVYVDSPQSLFDLQTGQTGDPEAIIFLWGDPPLALDFNGTAGGYIPQTIRVNFPPDAGGGVLDFFGGAGGYFPPRYQVDLPRDSAQQSPERLNFYASRATYYPPLAVVDLPRNSAQQDTWPWEPPPALMTAFSLPWGDGANVQADRQAGWSETPIKNADRAAGWSFGNATDAIVALSWGEISHKDGSAAALWSQAGFPTDNAAVVSWGKLQTKDLATTAGWDESVQARDQWDAILWGDAPGKDEALTAPWRSTVEQPTYQAYRNQQQAHSVDFDLAPGDPQDPRAIAFDMQVAETSYQDDGQTISPEKSGRTEATNGTGLFVPWGDGAQKQNTIETPWGRGNPISHSPFLDWDIEDPDVEPPPLPDRIPGQETYTVASSLTVVRKSDSTPIKVLSASAGLTMGDFAWRARIAIADQQGLDDLIPSGGVNQEALITINGQDVWVIVERWKRDTVFEKTTWIATCRGISAELDEPYYRRRDFISTGNSTAAQLANDELAGTGWTITWPAGLDYTIDAGEYSYQNLTPIRSIMRLANAIGAFVLPDPAAKTLTVVSRLEHKPADWSAQTPDAIVAQDAVVSIGHTFEPRQAFDYIQVSGGAQGVTVQATKQGQPGTEPARDIVDSLILDSTTGQERARVELYSSGPRAVERRQWPILAPVGVRLPGELIRNDDTAGFWFGQVQDVQISGAWQDGKGLACWQNITQHRYDL